MSSTIFEAPQYDPERERRHKRAIWTAIILVLLLAAVAYRYRNFPQERMVDKFFSALQEKKYAQAHGIWRNAPQWKQDPEKYQRYPFNEFYRDWGPSGDWGIVKSHKVLGSQRTDSGSGVIVVVDVK